MKHKIAFFIGTLSTGGAERAVSNLTLNLSNEFDTNIILFENKAKVEYPYSGKIIKVRNVKASNVIYKCLALYYRMNIIKKLKKKNEIKTMISFLEYPNLINLLTRKYGKTVISVRNHMSTKHKKGLKAFFWKKTIKILYKKADKIVAVSHEIKNDLVTNYGIDEDKITIIYNSYPIQRINELSKEPIEEQYRNIFEHPVIITAGRLNKQKGQCHLIRAFSRVKALNPNAKLVILGEGVLKEELEQLAEELKIKQDVHFLGFQQNPFKYINKSKVFVLSSLYEGFPNALAEAMACGIPIISTDCLSGPREILAPTHMGVKNMTYEINREMFGVLTPVCRGNHLREKDSLLEEELTLANHIHHLLNNEDLRKYYANRSVERISDFNINHIIKEWENMISKFC
ncbi:glycosyltransferase [Bacillus sp. SCS-151]|uniref:glycosyltransferase n=1 Tax=Nanhaiella sioensis TaxID=3115293 RepID=UPI0039793D52